MRELNLLQIEKDNDTTSDSAANQLALMITSPINDLMQ